MTNTYVDKFRAHMKKFPLEETFAASVNHTLVNMEQALIDLETDASLSEEAKEKVLDLYLLSYDTAYSIHPKKVSTSILQAIKNVFFGKE